MTAVTEPAAAGVHLDVPDEPERLREELRAVALAGGDWQAGAAEGAALGDVLWAHWAGALEPAGMSRAAFDQALAGYRRELWFWLLGDRVWQSVASGLAGRLVRRLPAG